MASRTLARSAGGGDAETASASTRRGVLQLVELGLQVGTGAQHVLQLRPLRGGQGADGLEGQQLPQLVVGHRDCAPIAARSRIRPSRIRVLTVPSATPRRSAIWTCVSPS